MWGVLLALLAADGETGDGGFGSGVGQQQFKRRGDVRRASLRTTEVLSRGRTIPRDLEQQRLIDGG